MQLFLHVSFFDGAWRFLLNLGQAGSVTLRVFQDELAHRTLCATFLWRLQGSRLGGDSAVIWFDAGAIALARDSFGPLYTVCIVAL